MIPTTENVGNPVQPPENEQDARLKWIALMERIATNETYVPYAQLEPNSWTKAALSHGMTPGFAFMVAWVKHKPVITSDILDPLFARSSTLDGRAIRELLVRQMHHALHQKMYFVSDMNEALAIANLACKLADVTLPPDPDVDLMPYHLEDCQTWAREVFKEAGAFVQRSIPAPIEPPSYGQMGALFLQANGSRAFFQNAISSMPEGVQGSLLEAWDHWVAHQAARKEMERQPRYAEEPPVFEFRHASLLKLRDSAHEWCMAKVEHAVVAGFENIESSSEPSSTDWVDMLPSRAEQEWDVTELLGEAFTIPAVSFLWETFTSTFMQNVLARVPFEDAIPALDFDGAVSNLYRQLALLNAAEDGPQPEILSEGEYLETLTALWPGA